MEHWKTMYPKILTHLKNKITREGRCQVNAYVYNIITIIVVDDGNNV
jgi:hypothetical protein